MVIKEPTYIRTREKHYPLGSWVRNVRPIGCGWRDKPTKAWRLPVNRSKVNLSNSQVGRNIFSYRYWLRLHPRKRLRFTVTEYNLSILKQSRGIRGASLACTARIGECLLNLNKRFYSSWDWHLRRQSQERRPDSLETVILSAISNRAWKSMTTHT